MKLEIMKCSKKRIYIKKHNKRNIKILRNNLQFKKI